MSNTGSIHCSVGHEISTDQPDGQNRCHLHANERAKMDTATRCRYRYHHQHRHVHFEGHPSSHSESDQSDTGEEDEEEEADVGKKLDTTESDDSYTIDLPRRRPHMAYLKMKRNMTITLDSVEKIATNVTKLMGVVRTLQDKVDELTEIQAMKANRGCGLSCTNNSLSF